MPELEIAEIAAAVGGTVSRASKVSSFKAFQFDTRAMKANALFFAMRTSKADGHDHVKDLAAIPGTPALSMMTWSLAIGVDVGGNLTPIGASANVVAYSYMEHNHGAIGWKRWLVIAVPPTILVMIIASLILIYKNQIGWY